MDGIAALTADVVVRPAGAPERSPGVLSSVAGTVTASAAGLQMGTLLAFLSARVLGQYDPFGGPGHDGRLLLVAPNVTHVRATLDVDAEDFALWVCLHEATHRLQFTAVDWLRDHFRDEVTRFAGRLGGPGDADDDDAGLPGAAASPLDRLPEIVRAVRSGGSMSLLEVLQGPEQRAVLDRLLSR